MDLGPLPVDKAAAQVRVRAILPEVIGVTATVLLIVAFGVLRLGFWHLRHPVLFSGDVGVVLEYIKNALQNGGTTVDPQVGWPNHTSLAAFPVFDGLSAGFLKVIGLVTGDTVVGANLLAYADHIASGVAGYLCFRALRLPRVAAVACAISFAYAEFALSVPRVFGHETLQLFAPVAVGATLALLPMARPRCVESRSVWGIALLASAAVGLSQPYWTAFSLLAIVPAAAGYAVSSRLRAAQMLVACGAAMVAVTVAGLIWPRLSGEPGLSIHRFAYEQPIYGLRLGDLLTPPRSALGWLNEVHARYLATRGDTNEGTDAFVGWPGLIGLAIAAAVALAMPFRRGLHDSPIALAATLIWFLVAFTLRHGLGEIFNTLVTPEIRAHNRVSPMIAFLAIYVFAATSLQYRPPRRRTRIAAQAAIVAVVAVGLWDQTAGLDYAKWQAEPGLARSWSDAKADAAAVEAALPTGARILQLPLMSYPEGGPVVDLGSYDQLHLPLLTEGYRYGFGSAGATGVYGAAKAVLDPESPIQGMVDAAAVGYDEVLFYRAGYEDGGAAIRQAIASAFELSPNIDAPGVFGFDLRSLAGDPPPTSLSAALAVRVEWDGRGFSVFERDADVPFRWDDSEDGRADVTIDNAWSAPVTMRFCGTVVPGTPGAYQITVDAAGRFVRPPVDPAGTRVDIVFEAPPGPSMLSLAMPSPRLVTAVEDLRHLHFQLRSPVLAPVALLNRVRDVEGRAGLLKEGECR